MLDERTRRAGERAAAARRRAFADGSAAPARARPLGVVPVLLLCLVGAVVDAFLVVAYDLGVALDAVSVGLVALAFAAAFALAIEHSWAWTITWVYLALHVFFDLLTVGEVGAFGYGVVVVHVLALTYATARRVVEVAGD